MTAADGATGDDALDPTSLRWVGPATAAVIERAPCDAAAVRDGRVSVRALREAGTNPGVAERLRREYGLPWSYRWHADGQFLDRRAAAMRDVPEAERRWIAAAAGGAVAEVPADGADGGRAGAAGDAGADDAGAGPDRPSFDPDDLDWPPWPEPTGEDVGPAGLARVLGGGARGDDAGRDDDACPRCGGRLSRFTLGERASVLCDGCGYAGVPVNHGGEGAWRTAVERLLRGERPPRRR